jgi:predicted kinase
MRPQSRGQSMLVVMAGLPATGKSTLAARLAAELGGIVLNKDTVRAALFPPPVLDYSAAQDDITMSAIYAAAVCILRGPPGRTVILDGRTFLRAYQVQDLLAHAAQIPEVPAVIECVCSDEVARQRLEADQARGDHPAGNRTFALYLTRKAGAEPLALPRLVLDTGAVSIDESVRRALAYLEKVRNRPAR